MKTVYLMVGASVEVTEAEYEKLRQLAYEPRNRDLCYKDIQTPDWLTEKIRASGKFDDDGWISAEFWMERR